MNNLFQEIIEKYIENCIHHLLNRQIKGYFIKNFDSLILYNLDHPHTPLCDPCDHKNPSEADYMEQK